MPPSRPTTIAHHLVWTAYGTWLPNDPRGSGSRHVFTASLGVLGSGHFGRRRKQPNRDTGADFYKRAEPRLQFSVLPFNDRQIDVIAAAFARTIREHCYTCYACAILRDHVHVVLRIHRHRAEQMIELLKAASRLLLSRYNQAPLDHPIWTRGGWRGFLTTPERVRAAIDYAQQNPLKSGLRAQSWDFVKSYDGWPHASRSPPAASRSARLPA